MKRHLEHSKILPVGPLKFIKFGKYQERPCGRSTAIVADPPDWQESGDLVISDDDARLARHPERVSSPAGA
jgi:hypothetical protein